jgi:hypothetical protein
MTPASHRRSSPNTMTLPPRELAGCPIGTDTLHISPTTPREEDGVNWLSMTAQLLIPLLVRSLLIAILITILSLATFRVPVKDLH